MSVVLPDYSDSKYLIGEEVETDPTYHGVLDVRGHMRGIIVNKYMQGNAWVYEVESLERKTASGKLVACCKEAWWERQIKRSLHIPKPLDDTEYNEIMSGQEAYEKING